MSVRRKGWFVSYWRCHYHLVWTTRQRMPVLDNVREAVIAKCVASVADEERLKLHAIGMVADHVHVAVSIPPRMAVASVVQLFKGSSSHQLRKVEANGLGSWPGWQPEYGVLTFGDRSIERIVAYVKNQKTHHQNQTLRSELEQVRGDQPVSPNASP